MRHMQVARVCVCVYSFLSGETLLFLQWNPPILGESLETGIYRLRSTHLEKQVSPIFSFLHSRKDFVCHLKTSLAVIMSAFRIWHCTIFMFCKICCLPSEAETQQHFQITGKENKFLEESCHPVFIGSTKLRSNRTHINIPDACLFWMLCLPGLSLAIQINTLDSWVGRGHQCQQNVNGHGWHRWSGNYSEKLISGN